MANVTINILGDGVLLESFQLRATDMPTPFSVFVEDIQQLRIEISIPRQENHHTVHYAIVGYLE